MALFLVQHGICLTKDEDPEQSLSPAGIATVERIAGVAKGYGITVSRIEHSSKARARQTSDILASALKPENGVHERDGLKPLDDVSLMASRLNSRDNLMLVGHLPFMERLASFLITGNTDRTMIKFQNGGIVCLDQSSDSSSWHIKWTLMPNIG